LVKAKSAGVHTVVVHLPDQFTEAHAAHADIALLTDYTDWDSLAPVVCALSKAHNIDAVVSNIEPALEVASRCGAMLGLPGNSPEVSRLLRDKAAMRQHLQSHGAPSLPWAPVSDAGSVSSFAEEHGYPVIVKPVDGSASLGVIRIDGPAALHDAAKEISRMKASVSHRYAEFFPLDHFIVEKFVSGAEYSVEAFSFDGKHVVIAITDKVVLPSFVESGHAVPAQLGPGEEDAIVRVVTRFLDVIGVQHGPTHTEVRLDEGRPVVIESHNRTGGDRIVDLVNAAYGLDLESMLVEWAAGLRAPLTSRPLPRAAATTRFVVAEPGRVVAVRGVEKVRDREGILDVVIDVTTGEVVPPLRASWDRVGQVIAVGNTAAQALHRCEQAVADLEVETVVAS
jgi:biotin carboxylase